MESANYLQQLEASKAVMMTSNKELADQLQLRNTELVSLQVRFLGNISF